MSILSPELKKIKISENINTSVYQYHNNQPPCFRTDHFYGRKEAKVNIAVL